MENIIQPNNIADFNFSNISLKNPKPVQGGSFLSSIKYNNNSLIIQTPKIKTKKGITQTNKHVYTDLVFENEDNEFTDWIENLQENVRDIILTKSDTWFHEPVTLDEIEYNWNNSLRTYKQTKQLLRTFIHKSKGISSSILKIYDADYKSKHINDITADTSIICILEITGLKFTSTSFQLDFCLRQVMILEDKPIFNEPLIKISTKKVLTEKNGEKNVSFNEKLDEITLETSEKMEENLENIKQETQEEDILDTNPVKIEENLEEVVTNIQASEVNKDVSENVVTNEVVDKTAVTEPDTSNNEISQFTQEVNEVNLDDLEKEAETVEIEKNKDELEEVKLTFDEEDAITLKNPNEIYLDIYRQAREKAKKAKQEAIKAYLEAKRIKELYMLEIVDSSEDESDSEEDSDDGEDELFSEN
tara:strand:- start:94 stop:1347 length:1254 start_codon:yes stop_codon:yes gene_type:complete